MHFRRLNHSDDSRVHGRSTPAPTIRSFVNGESWRASGKDATLMRKLADDRRLGAAEVARASEGAKELLRSWCEAGWAHEVRA